MPIMRGPSGATTEFMIPCFGEGIFVVVNTKLNCGGVAYWDGTSMQKLTIGDGYIQNITVQDGIATVIVVDNVGAYGESYRICFIPGNPLASS